MPDFLQSWEDRVPMGVVLSEVEQAALIVMADLLGVSQSVVYDGVQYAALAHRYKELMNSATEEAFVNGHGERIRGQELSGAEDQIARLAAFIMEEIDPEPSRGNEGAGECAMRIMRDQKSVISSLVRKLDDQATIIQELREDDLKRRLKKQANTVKYLPSEEEEISEPPL